MALRGPVVLPVRTSGGSSYLSTMTVLGKSRRGLLALGILVVALVPAARAGAASVAPPGNAQVNQYAETIPGASGGQPTTGKPSRDLYEALSGQGSGGGPPDSGGGPPPIPPTTDKALQGLGNAGKETAILAKATTPAPQRSSGAGSSGSSSGLSAVAKTVTGSDGGGMGFLLPLILAAVAGAGLTYVVVRRRARLQS
jgi:hypothetical protein